jgi:syringomycin synthetase protein SyrB1
MKIRGFRIEPREIEASLLRSPLVSACYVNGHDYGEGDVRLVAYIALLAGPQSWNSATEAALRNVASSELPDYMRPSAYMVLSALPLTSHGKIDKENLPSPSALAEREASSKDAGLYEEESYVLEMWRTLLGRTSLGVHDDFFDSGGTSLALIRSIANIRLLYKVNVDLGGLANGATAKALADLIRVNRARSTLLTD